MTEFYSIAETRAAGLREEAVELAALSWFELIGWRSVPGDYLAPRGPSGARSDYRQAVLEPELRSALATLNPDAAPAMIDAAVRAVLAAPSQDLLENNRAFYPLLASGIPVEVTENGERRAVGLRLLDRGNPRANRLLVANQFIVQGEREAVRADIAVFVNGLPLAVLELKSPADTQATLERAHTQLQNYKAKAPELMRCNQVLVISDGIEARIGSLTAGLDRFGPWRTIEGEALEDEGRPELEVLIRGAFAPERFLDLIVDYVAFEIEDGVVKSKKLAGYHQFHAVRKALASTVQGAGANGGRKGGVIWHTQGAGKSLTMLFFVRQLQLSRPLQNPTIVIETDRNDLDQQLFGTFCAHGSALRIMPRQADSAAKMRQLLRVDIGGVVFTSIQKFRGEDGGHPRLTDRRNVIVIADEAHRTQYGLQKRFVVGDEAVQEQIGFAAYLRQALPNATFVGFTGTPIELRDRKTTDVFGEVIDTYDMSQAVRRKLFCGKPWATIAIAVRFHHGKCGIEGPVRRIDILQNICFQWVIRDRALACFGTIDPYLTGSASSARVRYCPNPSSLPDLSSPDTSRAAYGIRPDTFVVLVYGVLDRRKCVGMLLEAAASLRDELDLTIFLAGPQQVLDLAALLSGEPARKLRDHDTDCVKTRISRRVRIPFGEFVR